MNSLSREDAFLLALIKGYDPEDKNAYAVKEQWKKASKAYFKDIAESLELDQSNIWFNAGGPTVSGDINLMGRKGDRFFHLFGDLDMHFFVVRRTKGMQDYQGSVNQIIEDRDMNKFTLRDKIRRCLT